MKKRIISILLFVGMLAMTLGGCIKKTEMVSEKSDPEIIEEDEAEIETVSGYDNPKVGIKFTFPAVWDKMVNEKGNMLFFNDDYGVEISYSSAEGMKMVEELPEEADQWPADIEKQTDEQKAILEELYDQVIPVCLILVENDGNQETELRAQYTDAKELGTAGSSVYTLLYNSKPDVSKLSDTAKKEFQAIWEAIPEMENDITFTGYKSEEMLEDEPQVESTAMDGDVQFKSTTIDGKEIDTTVFKPYKLTAINIWATWCYPCVSEMPELQKVYQSLPEGVNLLGICADAAEDPKAAKQTVKETGVKYENIVANKGMEKGFLSTIQAYPTTIFVDSEGKLVGEPIVGVPKGDDVSEAYLQAIEKRLAEVK